MALKDTTHTEFRTALEMIQADDDRIEAKICDVCSEIHDRPFWSRHQQHPDGAFECLTCRDRQTPQGADDAEVREAVQAREDELPGR